MQDLFTAPRPLSGRGGFRQLVLTVLARQLYHELGIKIFNGRQ
jgi:hypothetical protein